MWVPRCHPVHVGDAMTDGLGHEEGTPPWSRNLGSGPGPSFSLSLLTSSSFEDREQGCCPPELPQTPTQAVPASTLLRSPQIRKA